MAPDAPAFPYVLGLGVATALGSILYLYLRRVRPASVAGYAGCRGWCEARLPGCGGEHPERVRSWQLDRRCLFPLRRWGHGLWHVLTGLATGTLYYAIHLVR